MRILHDLGQMPIITMLNFKFSLNLHFSFPVLTKEMIHVRHVTSLRPIAHEGSFRLLQSK
jgi:hypothetical protein